MKSNTLRLVTLLLSVLITVSLLGACTITPPVSNVTDATSGGSTPTGEVAAEEPTKLKVFLRERWAGVDFDNLSINYIQEKTNTKWDVVVSNAQNKITVLLAAGEIFDIMNLGSDDVFERQLVEEGQLLPLNKYFDKAPNMYERKKDIWDSMVHADGNIYTYSASVSTTFAAFIPSYRKDWLDKFGLTVPKTIDEYLIVADKFSNGDPDGDGNKNTYALGFDQDYRRFNHIFAAYGALPFSWQNVNGEIINGTVHPGAREALRTMNKLYEMGTFDPEFITDDANRVKAKYIEGVYGAMCMPVQIFDTKNLNDYYKPFKDKNPDASWVEGPVPDAQGYTKTGLYTVSQRGWVRTAVSAKTKEVDAVMRVLDWLHTDEGLMFVNYGFEGQHYKIEDGVVIPLVDGNGQKEFGITQCYIAMEWLFKETSREFQQVKDYANSLGVWDPVDGIFVEEADLYKSDLEDYAKNQYLKIILGEVPVDEGFDELLSEWTKRGGDKLTEAYNKAYQAKLIK